MMAHENRKNTKKKADINVMSHTKRTSVFYELSILYLCDNYSKRPYPIFKHMCNEIGTELPEFLVSLELKDWIQWINKVNMVLSKERDD